MNSLRTFFAKHFGQAGPGTGGPSGAAVILFAALLSAYAVLVTNLPSFDPKYSIYLDISCVYWIQALIHPGLFAHDPVSAFYSAHLGRFNPESLWVWITSLFMRLEPCTLGLKFLSVLLCVWAAWLVRRLAEHSPARTAAGCAAVMFAPYFLSMDTFFGVPRCYGLLIFLGFALSLETRRFLLLPIFISLAFVFYPALAVMLAASAVFAPFFFRGHFRQKGLLPRYLGALAAGALFCLLILSRSVALENTAQAFASGAFQSGKFYQLVSAPLSALDPLDIVLNFLLNINEHGRLYAIFTFLLAAVIVYGFLRRPGRPTMLPGAVPVMLTGAGAAFLVLYFIHPVSASRQTTFIVPLALVFLAAEALTRLSGDNSRSASIAAACAALFLILHPLFNGVQSCRAYRPAYDYLERLPGDAVVAAYPGGVLAETIPVFAKKTPFFSDDFADQRMLLLNDRYELPLRRRALVSALYSMKEADAIELMERYGVDYLVFEREYYAAAFLERLDRSKFPPDKYLEGLLKSGTEPENFYLHAREQAAFTWKNAGSEGFILDLRALGRAGAQQAPQSSSGEHPSRK